MRSHSDAIKTNTENLFIREDLPDKNQAASERASVDENNSSGFLETNDPANQNPSADQEKGEGGQNPYA